MKAEKLPVFTVGVGSEQLPRDIQIDRVSTPRTVLKDASLLVDVVVRNTGYGGRTVTVDVEDEGRIVGSEKVQLPADGSPAYGPRPRDGRPSRVRGSSSSGSRRRTASSSRRTTCASRSSTCATRREQILYFEGEPRFEMKFLRRAVADDKNLEVVALQRTADNKYMRLFGDEPEDPEELVGGFPKTREELFKYRGLILGSVEAGRLLGRSAADDCGLRRAPRRRPADARRCRARSARAGTAARRWPMRCRCSSIRRRARRSPAPLARLKIVADARRPGARGDADCRLGSGVGRALGRAAAGDRVNAPLPAKPGATVLLNGTDERGRAQAVLASQRLRPRQGHRAHAAGHVAVADARVDSARGSDARALLAADAALAG